MGVADYADEEADRVKDGDADHAGGTESHYTYHRCQEIRASPAYARAEPPSQQTQFFPRPGQTFSAENRRWTITALRRVARRHLLVAADSIT